MLLPYSRSLRILLFSAFIATAHATTPLRCNGYSELCDRGFHQVAYATTHNAYAIGPSPAANQHNPILTQLDDGIRGFMLDTVRLDGEADDVWLCHMTCALLKAGRLVDTLREMNAWLDSHPGEIILIYIENVSGFAHTELAVPFRASGMLKRVFYKTGPNEAWPTLGQMVQTDKRVVVFSDSSFDARVPWMMYEYDYETQNSYTFTVNGPFTCERDRPQAPSPAPASLVLSTINHFVSTTFTISGSGVPTPNPTVAERVNSRASLGVHIKQCVAQGIRVNFVAVDFYEYGDVFSVVADLNGVTYTGMPTRSDAAKQGVQVLSDGLPALAMSFLLCILA